MIVRTQFKLESLSNNNQIFSNFCTFETLRTLNPSEGVTYGTPSPEIPLDSSCPWTVSLPVQWKELHTCKQHQTTSTSTFILWHSMDQTCCSSYLPWLIQKPLPLLAEYGRLQSQYHISWTCSFSEPKQVRLLTVSVNINTWPKLPPHWLFWILQKNSKWFLSKDNL